MRLSITGFTTFIFLSVYAMKSSATWSARLRADRRCYLFHPTAPQLSSTLGGRGCRLFSAGPSWWLFCLRTLQPLDIDLLSNNAPPPLTLLTPSTISPIHLQLKCSFYTPFPPPPFAVPPPLAFPLALVPTEHPFMCLKCRPGKIKVCVGEAGVRRNPTCG